MSLFDRYSSADYVDSMRVFLGESKYRFMQDAGFTEDRRAETGLGRLPKYDVEKLRAVEDRVNAKAARCEASDTTFGERLEISRDYAGYTDTIIAKSMGVSRELVRRWNKNINNTTQADQLAEFLSVPEEWLRHGGEAYLPANTHLGVRVGELSRELREQLYGMTLTVLSEIPDEATESYMQAFIEWAIFNRPEMSRVARQAGGRWQIVGSSLLFSPWQPIEARGLVRQYWSEEVEEMIQEELANQPTVTEAHAALVVRCEAKGLSKDQYPKLITLHKRVEKERERAEKFGVDLNDVVAASFEEHAEAIQEALTPSLSKKKRATKADAPAEATSES